MRCNCCATFPIAPVASAFARGASADRPVAPAAPIAPIAPIAPVAPIAPIALIAPAYAQPSPPELTRAVNDFANVIDPETEAEIERRILELQKATTDVVVVATIDTFAPYADIREYAVKMFENRGRGIGVKGKDNGVLFIVAPTERRVRIEVGYGLEGMLTDAVTRLIIDNAILPRFRTGDFAGGVERGTDDIIQVLSGNAEDFKKRAAERLLSVARRPRRQPCRVGNIVGHHDVDVCDLEDSCTR